MKTKVEIGAVEGGDDSKLLIKDLFGIYKKACKKNNFKYDNVEISDNTITFCL
jgi:protein subunit release factor A